MEAAYRSLDERYKKRTADLESLQAAHTSLLSRGRYPSSSLGMSRSVGSQEGDLAEKIYKLGMMVSERMHEPDPEEEVCTLHLAIEDNKSCVSERSDRNDGVIRMMSHP